MFIKNFKGFKSKTNESFTKTNESVVKVDNEFKVKTIANVPQSLINTYVKKVKDETGKELKDFYSDMDLAEELVKFAIGQSLSIDAIPAGAFLGQKAEDDTTDEITIEEPKAEEVPTEEPVSEEPIEETPIENTEETSNEEEESTEEEPTEEEEEEGSEELPL